MLTPTVILLLVSNIVLIPGLNVPVMYRKCVATLNVLQKVVKIIYKHVSFFNNVQWPFN